MIAEERVAESFTTLGDGVKRLTYAFSVLQCLRGTRTEGAGSVLRPDTVRRYAERAGFGRVEVLPIAYDRWRVYRLGV
jgi:hypothetical protein